MSKKRAAARAAEEADEFEDEELDPQFAKLDKKWERVLHREERGAALIAEQFGAKGGDPERQDRSAGRRGGASNSSREEDWDWMVRSRLSSKPRARMDAEGKPAMNRAQREARRNAPKEDSEEYDAAPAEPEQEQPQVKNRRERRAAERSEIEDENLRQVENKKSGSRSSSRKRS